MGSFKITHYDELLWKWAIINADMYDIMPYIYWYPGRKELRVYNDIV